MKKNFYIIGMLLSVFLVYFMLLVADRRVYLSDETVYDFRLEKEISFEELKKVAEEGNVAIQVRNYVSTEFGKNNIDIIVFDSNTGSRSTRKKSLFPNDEIDIIYNPDIQKQNNKCMLFTIQSNSKLAIDNVKQLIEELGYNTVVEISDISFNLGMLFSSLNAQFFLLMFVLVLLCIAMYYMSRTKEIGILKMNGWSNSRISAHMLKRMLFYSLVGLLPISGTFMVYILIMDRSCIGVYLYMCILLLGCFLISYILAAVVAIFFIKIINCVDAVKEKKNGHIVVLTLVIIKACITVLFCSILFNTYEKIIDIQGTIDTAKELKEYDYYEIQTPMALDEEMVKRINDCLNKVDDNYIYNYSSPDLLYMKSDLIHIDRFVDYETVCDSNYMDISDNLLHNFKIKKVDGNYVNKTELNGEALLVPEYLQEEVPDILEWLSFDKSTTVVLIENDQCYSDILWPGSFFCNPIVYVHSPIKEMYINSGEVLYDKDVVDEIKGYFDEVGVGTSSINIHSRSYSIDTVIAGYNTQLFEIILFSVIMLFAFVLTDFALIISYIQFNKKKIGVMVLHGKRVIVSTWKFLVLLILIDIVVALAINICFTVLILFDVLIYELEMNKTLNCGIPRLINGL